MSQSHTCLRQTKNCGWSSDCGAQKISPAAQFGLFFPWEERLNQAIIFSQEQTRSFFTVCALSGPWLLSSDKETDVSFTLLSLYRLRVAFFWTRTWSHSSEGSLYVLSQPPIFHTAWLLYFRELCVSRTKTDQLLLSIEPKQKIKDTVRGIFLSR